MPVTDDLMHALVAAARAARERAYAPYSRFKVGAALLDEQGRLHAGCNIENAAYPQGQCAEASAIAHLVLAGGTRILAAVVVGGGVEMDMALEMDMAMGMAAVAGGVARPPVTPCGGCRQRLREFGARDLPLCAARGQ
ncbi:MAG: cytidine deaminase, partial [Microbacteriaceae bacterium]|nr:cytidine deaminase [Burkholderiaceae bacterium]